MCSEHSEIMCNDHRCVAKERSGFFGSLNDALFRWFGQTSKCLDSRLPVRPHGSLPGYPQRTSPTSRREMDFFFGKNKTLVFLHNFPRRNGVPSHLPSLSLSKGDTLRPWKSLAKTICKFALTLLQCSLVHLYNSKTK